MPRNLGTLVKGHVDAADWARVAPRVPSRLLYHAFLSSQGVCLITNGTILRAARAILELEYNFLEPAVHVLTSMRGICRNNMMVQVPQTGRGVPKHQRVSRQQVGCLAALGFSAQAFVCVALRATTSAHIRNQWHADCMPFFALEGLVCVGVRLEVSPWA